MGHFENFGVSKNIRVSPEYFTRWGRTLWSYEKENRKRGQPPSDEEVHVFIQSALWKRGVQD